MDKAYELLRLLDQRDSLDARISKIRDELRGEAVQADTNRPEVVGYATRFDRADNAHPTLNRHEPFEVRESCGAHLEVGDSPGSHTCYKVKGHAAHLEPDPPSKMVTNHLCWCGKAWSDSTPGAAAADEEDEQPYTEAQAEAYMEEERR